MCPNCRNTLSVVPSDPPESGDGRLAVPISTVGEPPFFLYCNHCRWDSAEVGITFEKPTGLAAQLQKFEDSAPDSLEFERLKDHFEPFIRASSLSSSTTSHAVAHPSSAAHSHHLHSNSITAAASAALARDIPGVGKYNPLARSTSSRGIGVSGRDRSVNKDEMAEYRSRVEIAKASVVGTGGGDADVEFMRHLENVSEVASLDQRWENSWVTSLQTSDLKPLRIPLHSKRSKRCPACTHILIKPEQKAQSVRYKIKLVAANYLPAITVALPHAQKALTEAAKRTLGKSTSAVEDDKTPATGMVAGKTYPFHLALTNPLYDPIQVRLSPQRLNISTAPSKDGPPEKARRPPFVISLPTSTFPIAAFAEAWEYDDDEDMFGVEEGDDFGIRGGAREKDGRSTRSKTVGVLEKRANVTIVGGEVVIGKEAQGNVKFNTLVSYTYRSDDPAPSESNDGDGPSIPQGNKPPEVKTFAFYTVIDLGPIIPHEDSKSVPDV